MKHQTISLVKFKSLCRRLRQPLCVVVGALESIWIFAQIQARDGDLSRYTALDLAGWIEWPGDEEQLLAALVETGWLDRTEDGRLLIHDWDDHKPNWLKGVSARRGANGPELEDDADPNADPNPDGANIVIHSGHANGNGNGNGHKAQGANQVADQAPDQVRPNEVLGTLPGTELGKAPGTLPPNLTQPNPIQPTPNQTKPNPTNTQPNPDRRPDQPPPPSPPPMRGGGVLARKARSKPARGVPPAEYPAPFRATWELVERTAYGSTTGPPDRAYAAWLEVPEGDRPLIDQAWEAYATARRNCDEKTQHFHTWLSGDWRYYLAAAPPQPRLDPAERARLAAAEKAARDAIYQRWHNATNAAIGRGLPAPPRPPELGQPYRYYVPPPAGRRA